MKIFKDATLKEEILETFDFGIVEAGSSKEYTYYIQNETEARVVDIEISVENKEIAIQSFPKELKSKEVAKLTFKWSPSVDIKKGLKESINIKASEIYS